MVNEKSSKNIENTILKSVFISTKKTRQGIKNSNFITTEAAKTEGFTGRYKIDNKEKKRIKTDIYKLKREKE
jgi:hypothetical protein